MMEFKVGDKFEDIEELEKKIKQFECENFFLLWKRDCRSVEAAKHRVKRFVNPRLKYYEVKYACVEGGRDFNTEGKGLRKS